MPTDPQVTELDGTLGRVLYTLQCVEQHLDYGRYDAAHGMLLGIIDLLTAQRDAAPTRPLSWD